MYTYSAITSFRFASFDAKAPTAQIREVALLIVPINQQHSLAEALLALLSSNVALLNIADPRRRRAHVQMLHELA
jgi:hypothetical protein